MTSTLRLGGELTPASLTLGVRPTRAIVFVPVLEGVAWEASMTHALALQSLFWGGGGNIPIPLTDDLVESELFWQLLDVFDPDAFVVAVPTHGDMERLDPVGYESEVARLRETGVYDAYFEIWKNDPAIHPNMPKEIAQRIVRRSAPLHHDQEPHFDYVGGAADNPPFYYTNPFRLDGVLQADADPRRVIDVTTSLGAIEDLLLAVEVGRLAPGTRVVWEALDQQVEHQRIDIVEEWAQLLWGTRVRRPYPLVAMEHELAWYRARRFAREPFYFVTGGDVWDFVLFYALRRFTSRAHWLPSRVVEQVLDVRHLARHVTTAALRGFTDEFQVLSMTDPGGRAEIAAKLRESLPPHDRGRVRIVEADWREPLNHSPNRLFEHDRYGLPQAIILQDGVTPEIPTPIPRITCEDESQIHWMTDVRIEGWSGLRNRHLAKSLLFLDNYDTSLCRTSVDAVSYFCPHFAWFAGASLATFTVRPRLQALPLQQQVDAILKAQGWQCQPSDKGIYAAESAALVGSYADLGALFDDEDSWRVISAYRDKHAPGRPLAGDNRRYLRLVDMSKMLDDDTSRGAAALTKLESQGVITRGLALKCARCRSASFYALSDVAEEFRCRRCRLTQPVASDRWLDKTEPVWHYQLAEVIYQLLEHDGDLPIYAAVDHFAAAPSEPVALAFELDVFDESGRKSEHDLVLSQGSRLWIGEATKSDRFETDGGAQHTRFERIAAVADALDAHGIVLATSRDAFWDRAVAQANALFLKARRLEILTSVRTAGSRVAS